MSELTSFPINTVVFNDLDPITDAQATDADGVLFFDESVGVMKRMTRGELFKNKVIPINSIADFPAIDVGSLSDRQQFHLNSFAPTGSTGGGPLLWAPDKPKSLHDGIRYFSPTVPIPADFNNPTDVQNYMDGVGEEFPTADGIFELTLYSIQSSEFPAVDGAFVLWDGVSGNQVKNGVVPSTIGVNALQIPNITEVSYSRYNADESISMRTLVEHKTDLALNNVDNTSDANKPISTATQTALDLKANSADVTAALALKAPISSPVFTDNPRAPTPTTGDNDTSIATTAFVQAELVDRVQSVATIADLIALTGMTDGQQVSVQSFWGGWAVESPYIGPRGGGVFAYSASTPKSAHTGATVISTTVPTISAQAGANNSFKAANWINGVGETTPAGTGCWERIYQGEWVASWAGAFLNGTTNSQPQLQAWLDQAYNTAPLPSLYFEDGTYNIEGQGLKWDSAQDPSKRYRIKLRGANRNSTLLINAGSSYSGAIFDFGGDTVSNLKYESSISDIQFVGTGADYALSANYASYIDMTNVSCVGSAAIAGFANSGTFGSTYTNCLFKSALDGYLSTTISGSFNNATTFTSCSFWQNGRAGCNIGGSFKTLKFNNCIFEQNAHVGAIIGPGESVSFDTCYFELNATTGWTFTSPAINVKCDIIFGTGGSYMTTITNTADVSTGVVTLSETQGTLDCFIFAPGCSNLAITNNEKRQGQTAIPLVRTYGNTTESPADRSAVAKWQISDNKNFVEEVQFLNNTVPMRADGAVRDIRIKSKNAGYYTTPNLEQFSVGAGGVASVWSRSSRKLPDDPLVPVWDLSTAGAGTSDYRVFTADADYMTKYDGKLMVFGAWVYTPFTNDGASRLIVQNVLTQSSNDTTPGWFWKGYIFTCDDAATARFGIAKSGAAGAVSICKPTLCELGAFVSDLAGEVRKDFYGSAAPTTGTWLHGDRVWKTGPTSGTNPGWVCTVAGSPGTWTAMANLA